MKATIKKHLALVIVLAVMALAILLSLLVWGGMHKDTLMIRHQSEHLVFYCHKNGAEQARDMSPLMESAYARAAACLGAQPSGAIHVTVHPTQTSYEQAREKAGIEGAEYAFLSRQSVHIAPLPAPNEAAYEAAAYQTVRAMVRKLSSRPQNGILTDALAGYAAQNWDFGDLKEYAAQSKTVSFGFLTSPTSFELYEEFRRLEDCQAYMLFAVFLSEEGLDPDATGALWRVIRAREPINFRRATGYDQDIWNAAWLDWLDQFKPYSLESYA